MTVHVGMPRQNYQTRRRTITTPSHLHFIRGLRWIERVLVAAVIFCAGIAAFVWLAPVALEAMGK